MTNKNKQQRRELKGRKNLIEIDAKRTTEMLKMLNAFKVSGLSGDTFLGFSFDSDDEWANTLVKNMKEDID